MNTTNHIHAIRLLIFGIFITLGILLGGSLTPLLSLVRANSTPTSPDTAEPDTMMIAKAFKAFSDTITVDIPLGSTKIMTLTIQNVTTTTLRPSFFEAWATPAPGVADAAHIARISKVTLPDQDEAVDAQIMADLAASPDGLTTFFVFLKEQPDLSAAYQIADWGERGEFVYRTLVEQAERTQHEIRMMLDARGTSYEPLWIINGLIVHGNRDDIQTLAARAEVALLRADYVMSLYDEKQTGEGQTGAVSGCEPDERGICWNILQVGADRVWNDFGVSGQGITVGSLDSGVNYTHQALMQQYRGYRGNDQYHHQYNWFDAVYASPIPIDSGDHGSHTMGTIVGRGNGTNDQPAIGVAPGARWVSARICETSSCRESDILTAAQWMLAPTDMLGKQPRPDLRPHVINNSWSTGEGGVKNFVDFVTAWRAAGIFPVFAAGNSPLNMLCGNVASPGDYDTVVGVGATDKSGLIASYSRLGPSLSGRVKPDIVAPGSFIASAFAKTNESYGAISGTSMATPHVVGAIALIWSANPTLIGNYEATYKILTESATPRTGDERFSFPDCNTEQSPNNIYGYGFLNTYQAVAMAKIDVPWLQLSHTPELSLAPEQSSLITVTLDTRLLSEPGDYSSRILISTGDLSQTPYSIRVHMRVLNPTYSATVRGTIRDARTALPMSRAVVRVAGGATLNPDTNGFYQVTIPLPDQHTHHKTIEVEQPGYVKKTSPISVSNSLDYLLNVNLEPDRPIITVGKMISTTREYTLDYGQKAQFTIPISNVGTQPLTYEITIPFEQFSVWRSDEHSNISNQWVSPPTSASPIDLADDGISDPIPLGFRFPFSNTYYSEVRVGSNGLLVFGAVNHTGGFIPWDSSTSEVTPIPETESVAIMPLRTDLNPEEGGSIRYASIPEGFLVTYENVPLFDEPERIFTFQVLLTPEGSISFSYKKLSAVPKFVTVGVQVTPMVHQIVGEGNTVPITENLVLMMRPQPESTRWIVPLTAKGSIKPGEETLVPIELRWAYPFHTQPYLGSVAIRSNDDDHPQIRLPVQLRTRPFSHTITISRTKQPHPIAEQFTIPEGYRVRWHIPADTFSYTTTLTYTQVQLPLPATWPKGMIPLTHAFSLSASQEQTRSLSLNISWQNPVTLTLSYDPTGLNEEEKHNIQLWRWGGKNWEAIASPQEYQYDTKNNTISLAIQSDDLGQLALFFREIRYPLYMPNVMVSRR